MSLKILKKKSVYHVKGKVITPNVSKFLNYFTKKINKKKRVTLNIEEAVEIDKKGLKALENLLNLALNKQKNFYIVGGGCKEIYDHFQQAS